MIIYKKRYSYKFFSTFEVSVYKNYKKYTLNDLNKLSLSNKNYLYEKNFYYIWSFVDLFNEFEVGSVAWNFEEDRRRLLVEYWQLISNPFELNSKNWVEEDKSRKVDVYKKVQEDLKNYSSFIYLLEAFVKFDKKPHLNVVLSFLLESEFFFFSKKNKDVVNSIVRKNLYAKSLEIRNNFLKILFVDNLKVYKTNNIKDFYNVYFFLNEQLKLNFSITSPYINKTFNILDSNDNTLGKDNLNVDLSDSNSIHKGSSWGGDENYDHVSGSLKFIIFFKKWNYNIRLGWKLFKKFLFSNFLFYDLNKILEDVLFVKNNDFFLKKIVQLNSKYSDTTDSEFLSLLKKDDSLFLKQNFDISSEETDFVDKDVKLPVYISKILVNNYLIKLEIYLTELLLFTIDFEDYKILDNSVTLKDEFSVHNLNLDYILDSFYGKFYKNQFLIIFNLKFNNFLTLSKFQDLFMQDKTFSLNVLEIFKKMEEEEKIVFSFDKAKFKNLSVLGSFEQREFLIEKISLLKERGNILSYNNYLKFLYFYFKFYSNFTSFIFYNKLNSKSVDVNWYFVPFFKDLEFSYDLVLSDFLKLKNASYFFSFDFLDNNFYDSLDSKFILSRTASGFFKYSVDFCNKVLVDDGSFSFKEEYTYFNGFSLLFKVIIGLKRLINVLNFVKK